MHPLQGLILIFAPRRGRTLDAFLELCHGKFDIYLKEEFDDDVTLSHQKVIPSKIFELANILDGNFTECASNLYFFFFLQKLLCPDYNSDHNYPLMVQLKKR